ncbi:Harbinger transposase-derived nuclease [Quillaja saponaria]|uniref:Harbinger transposase-derived nuclease n=1 Tax=Quillaja saponaria TaxID=32244 RepID=A0AAD7KUI5_QUISA|nr:Harbinger transposase-derived nuclease [Quillaja saponaria]
MSVALFQRFNLPRRRYLDFREEEIPSTFHHFRQRKMEPKKLAALLSSLIAQILLLILLLFPSSTSLSLPSTSNSNSDFDSNSYANIFPLIIHHFLLSQEIAASLSLVSISRKRKRAHLSEPDSEPINEGRGEEGPSGHQVQLALPRSPDSFKNSFKMSSSTFEWLSGLLEPLLECRDPVGLLPLNFSAGIRLGIGLFRLANGCEYSKISKQFGVSESAARFCVKQLCRVLCTNFRFWVAFPSPNELKSVSDGFESISGLPNCCGVIASAGFNIVNKEKSCEDSIAAQIVVDSTSKILNIVAGFHGNQSNLNVLKSSTLYKDVKEGRLLNSPPVFVNGVAINQYLIGDAGYPLLPWLMVPFLEIQPGSFEEKFNAAHNLMLLPALQTIASLKNWGILGQPIQEELNIGVAYIGACSILHNMLLMREDFSALSGVSGERPCHQSFQYSGDTRLDDSSGVRKALVVRSTLATRAK